MKKNVYFYGKNIVAVINDNPDSNKVLVKFLKGYRAGSYVSVERGHLSKVAPGSKNSSQPSKNLENLETGCSTCKTLPPNFEPGIECPGCGFKEWLQRNL